MHLQDFAYEVPCLVHMASFCHWLLGGGVLSSSFCVVLICDVLWRPGASINHSGQEAADERSQPLSDVPRPDLDAAAIMEALDNGLPADEQSSLPSQSPALALDQLEPFPPEPLMIQAQNQPAALEERGQLDPDLSVPDRYYQLPASQGQSSAAAEAADAPWLQALQAETRAAEVLVKVSISDAAAAALSNDRGATIRGTPAPTASTLSIM